jgi:hypothetical protein
LRAVAQARRAVPDEGRSGFQTAFAELADAGGVDAVVVGPAAARELQKQAVAGDRQAKTLLQCLITALIEPDWHDGSWLCGRCNHVFRELPRTFLLLVPRYRDALFIAVGFCDACDAGKLAEIVSVDGQRADQIVARRFCALQLSTKE